MEAARLYHFLTKMVVVVGRGRKVVTVGTVIEGTVIVGSVDDTTVVTVMVEVTVSSVGDGVGVWSVERLWLGWAGR